MEVMTKEKISFWILPTLSLSHNPIIGLCGVLAEVLPSFLWIATNYAIFVFIVSCEGIFSRGPSPIMVAMCWRFPLLYHLCSLLAHSSLVMV